MSPTRRPARSASEPAFTTERPYGSPLARSASEGSSRRLKPSAVGLSIVTWRSGGASLSHAASRRTAASTRALMASSIQQKSNPGLAGLTLAAFAALIPTGGVPMAVATPYHDRRTHERRRIAYPGLFGAEGMRVSWGGIFGGVLVAVGTLLLLAALGVAIGITAVDPQSMQLGKIGMSAALWTAVSMLLSLFLGGMVSSRLGATFDRTTSFFEGFLVWVVSLLLVAYLAASGMAWVAGDAFAMMGGQPDL